MIIGVHHAMNYRGLILLHIIVIAILWAFLTRAHAENLPLEHMAVPERMFDTWSYLPQEVQDELRALIDAPPQEVDRLLSSADPREVGLGLFVLDQNAELEKLILLANLLEDSRPTIPSAAPLSTNHFHPHYQSVREYLASIYLRWFGMATIFGPLARRDSEQIADKYLKLEEARVLIAVIDDPWARPAPWLIRLYRASSAGDNRYADHQLRAPLLAEVKAQIAMLPSDIRWAVIAWTIGSSAEYYSPEEARSELLLLDQSVRDQIMTGDPLAAHAGEIGWNVDKDLAEKARALLQASP